VPWGYLWTVASLAVLTLLAVAPQRRPRPLATLSFRLGLLINEVPVIGIVWLVGWTALAYAQGDLDSPGALAVAGLAVLTAAGLAVLIRRGLRAGPAVAAALTDGLGAEVPRRRLPVARILLLPFRTRSRDVERIADLSYGDAGRRNQLDVYRHRSRPAGGPVLIHLHGGGYRSGRKNSQSMRLLYRLAAEGWVCVSANFRLQPDVRHPEHLIDVKKVIAWVREHGPGYGADPATLIVAGSSTGAHLAALAALTPGDPAFQPGFEDADTSVSAAIGLGGYYGNYFGQGPESSPLAYARPDAPPFFLAHGDRDTVSFVENARDFADALRAISAAPVVYAELPGGQHTFDLFRSPRFEAVIDGIETFTSWVRAAESARQ
jgi:acetyl esterase/lipase